VAESLLPEGFRPAEHRFGIGLRGGLASLCQKMDDRVANGKCNLGGEGALDLEYTYLSQTLNSGVCQLGLKTGVSLSIGSNTVTADGALTGYSMKDIDGRDITYLNSAYSITEYDTQLMVEIPLMFALRGTKGFSFAIGPKLGIPVAGWYVLNYRSPIIDCYYHKTGVHEINEVVTGQLKEVATSKDNKLRTATFNLMMASEIGYEWALKNGDGLGLLVYGGYYVVSGYKLNSDPTQCFIYVDGPKAGGPTITGNALMNDCGSNMGYMSAGLKLTYQFSFPKNK